MNRIFKLMLTAACCPLFLNADAMDPNARRRATATATATEDFAGLRDLVGATSRSMTYEATAHQKWKGKTHIWENRGGEVLALLELGPNVFAGRHARLNEVWNSSGLIDAIVRLKEDRANLGAALDAARAGLADTQADLGVARADLDATRTDLDAARTNLDATTRLSDGIIAFVEETIAEIRANADSINIDDNPKCVLLKGTLNEVVAILERGLVRLVP
ncbi:MAG: hypothetical protein LBJ96_03170 [Holosporaceae bacterium]|jgi:hypothetical protein|nr:hypothetical protein [Holosporaceae bacterium]